jgi:hypothetical protein
MTTPLTTAERIVARLEREVSALNECVPSVWRSGALGATKAALTIAREEIARERNGGEDG